MVVLLHEEGSGMSHFDWLLAPDAGRHEPDERGLIHFRCARSPRSFEAGETMKVVRGGPHRWLYLEFQGELAGGRGVIRRIAQGRVEILGSSDVGLNCRADWGEGWQEWEGACEVGNHWTLTRKA